MLIVLWISSLIGVELMHSSQADVKVLTTASEQESCIWALNHHGSLTGDWVKVAHGKWVVLLILGDLDILNQSLSRVGWPLTSIQVDLEREWSHHSSDLNRLSSVDLGHTLDLIELHVVTLLVAVALILVDGDHGLLLVGNRYDHELLAVLTISVVDSMLGAIVNEGIAEETKGLAQDEANVLFVAESVGIDNVLEVSQVLSVAHNVVVSVILKSQGLEGLHSYIGVELGK